MSSGTGISFLRSRQRSALEDVGRYIKTLFALFFCIVSQYHFTHAQEKHDSLNIVQTRFQSAVAFSVDPSGNIFIADGGTNEIYKYKSDGSFIQKIGGSGWSDVTFDRLTDVTAPNGLDVYAADYGNHRIQRYDRNLTYITTLSFHDNDNPDMRFGYPKGVALDRFGAIYIIDGENTRIVKIKDNAIERVFGGLNAGDGRLINPSCIRVSNNDFVYVLDDGAIVEYDLFGNFIMRYPSSLFSGLKSIALMNDSLVALDSCRISLLTPSSLSILDVQFPLDDDDNLCDVVNVIFQNSQVFCLTRHRFFEGELVRRENQK